MSSLSYKQVSSAVFNNYVYLKNLQIRQVTNGHPSIYYNGSIIILAYSNGSFTPPANLTITEILYLTSNNVWEEVPLQYPLTIYTGKSLQLPSYVLGKPIIIVTSLGNIFFLTPGSSIGPFSLAGKAGVEIITQISNSSFTIGTSANITTNIYGKWENFTTPIAFPNESGTFEVKVPEYVFYENSKGQIITGVFHNWAILGQASLNSTSSLGIRVTLEDAPAVLIANYTPLLAKATLCIETNYPQSTTISIDGRTYTITNGEKIQIPAGFANVTVFTLQGTIQVSSEVKQHYVYDYMQYQSTISHATSMIIFIPPDTTQTLKVEYDNNYNCYLVTLEAQNNDGYPVSIGNNLYNYGQSYWFIGGNYSFVPIGFFCTYANPPYTYGAVTVYFNYSNGTTFTYNFPNIPGYVIINQPMTICVIYGVELYWQPLT